MPSKKSNPIIGMTPVPTNVLTEAQKLVEGDRQDTYGDKLYNQAHIAMMFQAYLAPKLALGCYISPEDASMLMIMVKAARLAKTPDHRDSLVDIAGYALVMDKLQDERTAGGLPSSANSIVDFRLMEKR